MPQKQMLLLICLCMSMVFICTTAGTAQKSYPSIERSGSMFHISCGTFTCDYSQTTGIFDKIIVDGHKLPVTVSLQLLEGVSQVPIKTTSRMVHQLRGNVLSFQTFTALGVEQHTLTICPTYIRYHLRLISNVEERKLVECRLAAVLEGNLNGWSFWDGDNDPVNLSTVQQSIHTNSISIEGGFEMGVDAGQGLAKGIFPACAVLSQTAGIALGISPDYLCSYYGSLFEPAPQGGTGFYITRRVLEPLQSVEFSFVLFARETAWAERSILEGYYQTAPAIFDRDPDTYPDAYGLFAAASAEEILEESDRFIDKCRRGRVGALHSWGTSPSGDIETGTLAARPGGIFYTDDEPAVMYYKATRDGSKELFTLSQQELTDAVTTANISAITVNYIIPTKCDRTLALKMFDDAIVRRVNGQRTLWPRNEGMLWTAMNAGWTSFGKSIRSDLYNRINRYHPDGIYFDNGAMNWRDYGNDHTFPAFDDGGNVYSNVGLAYAILCDSVRVHYPAVHLNPGEVFQYFLAFRGDSHLSNIIFKYPRYPQNNRYLLGKKLMYHGHPRYFPVTQNTTEKRSHLKHPLPLLKAFRWGAPPWISTAAKPRPDAELIGHLTSDLAMAGWEPVAHARCNNPTIWIERFQRGDRMLYFTVINPTGTQRSVQITIDNDLHPDGLLPICAPYPGSFVLPHTIDPTDRTVTMKVDLKPQSVLVLRCIGWLAVPASPVSFIVRQEGFEATLQITEHNLHNTYWILNPLEGTTDKLEVHAVQLPDDQINKKDTHPLPQKISIESGQQIKVFWKSRYQIIDLGCFIEEAGFLKDAESVSIIASPDRACQYRNARRISGFIQMQAELLGKQPAVEIIPSTTQSSYNRKIYIASFDDDRILQQVDQQDLQTQYPSICAALVAVDTQTLLLTGKSEWDMRLVLNKYLDTIEAPIPYPELRLDTIVMR